MTHAKPAQHRRASARKLVLRYLRSQPGTLFKAADVTGASRGAISTALSRLVREGVVERASKGLYYAPKETLLGKSRPSEAAVARKTLAKKTRPTGATAANLLGVSTQVPAREELAVYAQARPKTASGTSRLRFRGRGEAGELSQHDAALLEFLRQRGRHGELDLEETLPRLYAALLSDSYKSSWQEHLVESTSSSWLDFGSYLRTFWTQNRAADDATQRVLRHLAGLRDAALHEPPRVRAVLGALLQNWHAPERTWLPLRKSLNPLSRFDFGLFRDLPTAKEWQAK